MGHIYAYSCKETSPRTCLSRGILENVSNQIVQGYKSGEGGGGVGDGEQMAAS